MDQKVRNVVLPVGAALLVLISNSLAAAETTLNIKTQGVAILNIANAPMADGSIAQTFTSKYVEMGIEGDMKGQTWGGDCAGSGLVTAEGAYSGQYRCTATLSADDAFTLSLTDTQEGADWIVTGGKGKFKGATGKGHTAYTWGDSVFGDKIVIAGEGTIVLP